MGVSNNRNHRVPFAALAGVLLSKTCTQSSLTGDAWKFRMILCFLVVYCVAFLWCNALAEIAPTYFISTAVAWQATSSNIGDNGPASSAYLNQPQQIWQNSIGKLYIADYSNNRIRMVATNNIITTVVGTSTGGAATDGIAGTSSKISTPLGVFGSTDGVLYMSEYSQHKIHSLDEGILYRIAGTGTAGSSGDNGPATSALISSPTAMWFDSLSNLYSADSGTNRLRKINALGIMIFVTGTGGSSGSSSGDGGAASSASFAALRAPCADTAGNIYLCWRSEQC